ncbi:MAG: ABC transporter permease [Firmicutes bacterium]|nr:ABC transporter permease [Bacillota bacterium]
MLNYIRAEWIKIIKTRFLWILLGMYTLIFILLFYQFTLNEGANVIEPLLKNSINLYSFFIIMYSAFLNIIFAVTLGSHIAANDYSYNTIQTNIQLSGRYRLFISKLLVMLILVVLFVFFIALIGILLGLIHEPIVSMFSLSDFLKRLAFGITSTYLMGLFAMTVATIFKSTSRSNIICIILFLGQSLLPYGSHMKYLHYLNPYFYVSYFAEGLFSNLKGLSNITVSTINTLNFSQNIMLIVGYCLVCFAIQFLIFNRREYS